MMQNTQGDSITFCRVGSTGMMQNTQGSRKQQCLQFGRKPCEWSNAIVTTYIPLSLIVPSRSARYLRTLSPATSLSVA